jgi:transposase
MVNAMGIDVSKDKLDVVLLNAAQQTHSGVFANNAQGFEQLQRWLSKRRDGEVHACLEATGQYGEAVAEFLHQAGHTVSVVNPARIKAFAASRLSRQKTDPTDAKLIAHFCQSQQLEPWQPPVAEQRALQAIVRHLADLKAMRQQERNRLTSGVSTEPVVHALQQHIAFLDQQIADLERQIHDHLNQFPHLKQQRDLLDSIPGLGELTIATVLAEVPNILAFETAAQLAAFAGVTPRQFHSGSSVHRPTHISKCGNAHLRAALYFPAMVALRHNPIIRAFGDRLKATGHTGKSIVVAAMRKLLHLIYGVLKSGRPFDPNYVPYSLLVS